jgi:hypothetical protein
LTTITVRPPAVLFTAHKLFGDDDDDQFSIDLAWLRRRGILRKGWIGGSTTLTWSLDGEKTGSIGVLVQADGEARRNPIFDACRALFARGITGRLELWRRGKTSADIQPDIERGTGLAIKETATESLRIVTWEPWRPNSDEPSCSLGARADAVSRGRSSLCLARLCGTPRSPSI